MNRTRQIAPGLLLCAAVAAAGTQVATLGIGASLGAAVMAMVIGIAIGHALPGGALRDQLDIGTTWVVRVLLPLGIVLLGSQVELRELAALGPSAVGLALLVVALSASVFVGLARVGYLPTRMAALLAVGSAICGGSAIAAASPVLGARRDETAASVSAVVLVGTVGTLLLPVIAAALDLSDRAFGMWAGLTLQQTPQVVAAALARGPEAGEIATAVKLIRICLLIPAVFALAYVWRSPAEPASGSTGAGRRALRLIPPFLWGFLALSAASSLSLLPAIAVQFDSGSALFGGYAGRVDIGDLASSAAGLCLVAAMAAIGLQTRLEDLRESGPRALVAALLAAVVITGSIGALVA